MLFFPFQISQRKMHSQKSFLRFFYDASVPIPNGHTIAELHSLPYELRINRTPLNQSVFSNFTWYIIRLQIQRSRDRSQSWLCDMCNFRMLIFHFLALHR